MKARHVQPAEMPDVAGAMGVVVAFCAPSHRHTNRLGRANSAMRVQARIMPSQQYAGRRRLAQGGIGTILMTEGAILCRSRLVS